ncbi:MAG TPA: protein kinase, partial [Myxococcota bacterium]|nr:protein kinase [Myxococcota bacterium]
MASAEPSRRRFELRRLIGQGAFGEVYLAEQVSTGGFRRPVALKILNESAARMREAARRMRDEARILGRLQHRHIVEVLDLVQLGDRWAIVMAWVPGADLEQLIDTLGARDEVVPP